MRAQVPIEEYSYNATMLSPLGDCPSGPTSPCPDDGALNYYKISVTPVVYVMALVAFVGWFLFVVFGAVGMAALPIDLMLAYKQRPQSIDLQASTVAPQHAPQHAPGTPGTRGAPDAPALLRCRSTRGRRICSTSALPGCSRSASGSATARTAAARAKR